MVAKRCTKCNHPHLTRLGKPACGGHAARGTRPCKNAPMDGQKVCGKHGGQSPQAKAAAARRLAEERAARAVERFGGRLDTTPTEALLETVQWTAGYVAWLRDRVNDLDDEKLTWGITRDKSGGNDWGSTFEAGANVWLKLLGEWSDRLVKVCSEAIKAGIEERRVRLAEGQGKIIADVIRSILDDLKLSPEQQSKVGEIVPRHLRLVAS
ncbi:MAG: hypothetical protein JWQ77_2260 [Jatrophihabitans sp.]|nr:hypothetical protein [Jatrophihabitans sp.]